MLNIYTVSFFGHRQIDNFTAVEQRLEELIRELIATKEYVEFLVGRNGEFDQMAASTVLRMRRVLRDDNSALVLVLPYPTAEFLNNQTAFENYYTDIEVSDAAARGHFKSAIQRRNREMVDRSDLIVCCIERKTGGAYQTVQDAKKMEKHIVNVSADAFFR